MGNAGMPFYDSIELDELHCPLIIHTRRLRRDSEGPGMFRGAPGAEIEYGPVDCDVEVGFACDGVVNPAQGVRGGSPGAVAEAYLRRATGERQRLPGSSHLIVARRIAAVIDGRRRWLRLAARTRVRAPCP